jgi:hypothetical protein
MNCCTTIDSSSEEECYVALIEKGRNIKKIPKWIAVLAIVKKWLDRFLGVINGMAEALNGKPISHQTVKETTILWNYIPTAIACNVNETI